MVIVAALVVHSIRVLPGLPGSAHYRRADNRPVTATQVVSIDGAIAAAATEMVDDIRRRNAQSAAIADAAAAAGPAQPLSAQPVRCL